MNRWLWKGLRGHQKIGRGRHRVTGERHLAGMVTNSILFLWLFTIKERCNIMHFQQTHNQGLRQLFLTVSLDHGASEAPLTVFLYLCRTGSNAQGESRALEGWCASAKSLSRVRDWDEEIAARNGREKYHPWRGVIDLPSRQVKYFFYKKKKQKKIWVSNQTCNVATQCRTRHILRIRRSWQLPAAAAAAPELTFTADGDGVVTA